MYSLAAWKPSPTLRAANCTARAEPHSRQLLPSFDKPSFMLKSKQQRSYKLTHASGNGTNPAVRAVVADVMTTPVIACNPESSIIEALELLVTYKITGLPVVDNDNKVVGVVSDFDLLPLEAITAPGDSTKDFFPDVNTDWTAFNEVQTLILKNAGKSVADVMTPDPLVVRPTTCLVEAAQILLKSRVRRLPVVDADGKLVGVISRGNVVKAALAARKSLQS